MHMRGGHAWPCKRVPGGCNWDCMVSDCSCYLFPKLLPLSFCARSHNYHDHLKLNEQSSVGTLATLKLHRHVYQQAKPQLQSESQNLIIDEFKLLSLISCSLNSLSECCLLRKRKAPNPFWSISYHNSISNHIPPGWERFRRKATFPLSTINKEQAGRTT